MQKTCNRCGRLRLFFYFQKNKMGKFGLRSYCTECNNKNNRKNYDPSKRKEYVESHKEQIATYLETDQHKANHRRHAIKYRKENPGIVCAFAAKYRAATKQATPAWRNDEAIIAIYKECARITKESGIQHHVDHIYPIQSEIVCGLHVESNLQILTAQENLMKSNKIDEKFI